MLIGDRPVSRPPDREHRKISSIHRESGQKQQKETQEEFLQRSNAVEITIRTCKITSPVTPVSVTIKDEIKSNEDKVSFHSLKYCVNETIWSKETIK